LSSAAFNAFLKTLEEPPKHAIFILATTENIKLFQRYFLVVKYLISRELP
jgi:DNA polymerase III delta prime subunit